MSMLSRNTRGVRRGTARMAAVFAGTLMTYLVVTAVPAQAVSTCALAADPAQLNVVVGTDDVAAITEEFAAGEISLAFNGGAFADCPGTSATVDYINVTGSDAGAETLVIWNPTTFGGENMSVGLGNGVDRLVWEYGPLGTYVATVPGWALADPSPLGADAVLGTSTGGLGIGDFNNSGIADLRIDNAETVILNGNAGVGVGADDVLDAGNVGGIAGFDFACCGTADAIPGATAPFAGPLTLNGGNGNDFLVSGNGADAFIGAAGQDTVSYAASAAGVVVDLAAGTGTGMGTDTLSDVQDAAGSLNADTLLGSALNNNLSGDGGDDIIDGREGNDGATAGIVILTGLFGDGQGAVEADDDDTLTGGTGNDLVFGNQDDDIVNEDAAANGADNLSGGGPFAGGGCDTLNYGLRTAAVTVNETTGIGWGAAAEADFGGGFELIISGSGNDTLVGNGSAETFTPGAGDDSVNGNGDGAPGADQCNLVGFDYLDLSDGTGAATFNLITGTATGNGTDTFSNMEGYVSGASDDVVIVGDTAANGNTLGDFVADGGIDLVDGSAATINLVIDLTFFGFDCSPTVGCLEVENVIGGAGNDTITGNGLNNNLVGGAGVDVITGNTGNDRVEGGAGNDILTGGPGGDTLVYRNAPSGVEVDTQLGFATGGDGEDSLGTGLGAFEIVLGSDFNDTIIGGQSSVDLNNRYKGFKGNDLLIGTNSTDVIAGGAGNDRVLAGGGDDIVRGAGGNDDLFGARGNDNLLGGGGQDFANGQQGFDFCKAEQEQSCEA